MVVFDVTLYKYKNLNKKKKTIPPHTPGEKNGGI